MTPHAGLEPAAAPLLRCGAAWRFLSAPWWRAARSGAESRPGEVKVSEVACPPGPRVRAALRDTIAWRDWADWRPALRKIRSW
jgi:hypothetical protein